MPRCSFAMAASWWRRARGDGWEIRDAGIDQGPWTRSTYSGSGHLRGVWCGRSVLARRRTRGRVPAHDAQRQSSASTTSAPTAPAQHAHVFLAGPVRTPSSPADAVAQIAAVAARNGDIVKISVNDNPRTATKMPPEIYRAVIDASPARGLRVAMHQYHLDDAKALLAAGADCIAPVCQSRWAPTLDRWVDSRATSS
jgi:hypothetical protein